MGVVGALGRLGNFLRERQRWALLGLLVVLHLTLMAGGASVVGLMCWFVDVGFFILWQPFIRTERKLDYSNSLLIAIALALGAWLYSWWLLLGWVTVLASLLGGRVMLVSHRPTRVFYLLAFAYLLGAVLIWMVPKVVPDASLLGLSLERPFAWAAPLLFVGMLLLPRTQDPGPSRRGMYDFFYGVFIFLLISVLVLGSLAFMLLERLLYFEALFRTVISMALLLLTVAWAWNPRPGFSGVGAFFSQYLLTVGLPFDTWLRRLMECAERESEPDAFLKEVGELLLLDLPWVVGGKWSQAAGESAGEGAFGKQSAHVQEFMHRPLVMTIYARYVLSPVLTWHLQLLTRLACEHYVAIWRARELQQVGYLRAVHETGARLTHDVKNLLQSLDSLCYLMESSGDDDSARLQQLLRKQLPQIGQRLRLTLDKLQPSVRQEGASEQNDDVPAREWWEELQQRFYAPCLRYDDISFDPDARLPSGLFDSVADNLLHNALIKFQSESGISVDVSLSPDATVLKVCDNGSALSGGLADRLFHAPVASENGFGVGLFNAARQSELLGYALRLASNAEGCVCFELAKKGRPQAASCDM